MKLRLLGAFTLLSFQGYSQTAKSTSDTGNVVMVVEQLPEFPGGTSQFYRYLAKNINYPDSARIKGIEGTVFVSFEIDGYGQVSEVAIVKGVSPELDKEALRVIKGMPRWKPGKQSGRPISVTQQVPVKFKQTNGPVLNSPTDVDQLPEFPGGETSLLKMINKTLYVPKGKKMAGNVVVEFIIDSTGVTKDHKIIQGLAPKYDEAAIRVIQGVAPWKPGYKDGKPVEVKYRLTVLFKD